MPRLIRADFHVHTTYSACAHPDANPVAVLAAARVAGLEAIGITDHVVFPGERARSRMLREQLARGILIPPDGIKVYVSAEAEMQSPTRATIDAKFAADLDYVLMSASHLHNPGMKLPDQMDVQSVANYCLELMNGAIRLGFVDIIAHPFHVPIGPFVFQEVVGALEEEALYRTAEAAARAGVAIEMNPAYLRQAPDAVSWLFRQILETECKVAIGSDAHHPSQIGCRGPRYASETEIRALGIGEENLWINKKTRV